MLNIDLVDLLLLSSTFTSFAVVAYLPADKPRWTRWLILTCLAAIVVLVFVMPKTVETKVFAALIAVSAIAVELFSRRRLGRR